MRKSLALFEKSLNVPPPRLDPGLSDSLHGKDDDSPGIPALRGLASGGGGAAPPLQPGTARGAGGWRASAAALATGGEGGGSDAWERTFEAELSAELQHWAALKGSSASGFSSHRRQTMTGSPQKAPRGGGAGASPTKSVARSRPY